MPSPEVMYHPISYRDAETHSSTRVPAVYVMGEDGSRPEMRAGWWWQRGPVDSFCFIFSLRVGICLIAILETMREGLWCLMLKRANSKLVDALDIRKESFVLYCAERTNHFCQGIRAGIAKSETEVDLALAQEPLYRFMGIVLINFSLLGLRAAYMEKQAEAKVYSAIFPMFFCFSAALLAQSLGTISEKELAKELAGQAVHALALVYYFKVTWSFYTKCKAAEERRSSSAEASSRREQGVQLLTAV